jgi:hypothetical protein
MLALSNIYGCCSYAQYVHIWNLQNKKEPINLEEAEAFFTPMESKGFHIWLSSGYIINDIITAEEFAQLLVETKDRPWYSPSEEEIEANVQLINTASSEYKMFETFFKKHKGNIKTKKHLKEILWDLTCEMKYVTRPSVAFDILSDNHYTFDSDKAAEKFLEVIQEASNNSRKWVLRGFTPTEIHNLFGGF